MIRMTEEKDIPHVMEIIHMAQEQFCRMGIDQWQDGYPNKEVLLEDIKQGYSYVLEEGHIIGTMSFKVADDPDYARIDGKWLCEGSYGVIHRIVNSYLSASKLADFDF